MKRHKTALYICQLRSKWKKNNYFRKAASYYSVVSQLEMQVLLLAALCSVALSAQADYTRPQFARFQETYGKRYHTRAESQFR